MNYRAAIRAAVQEWETGGCFRSKSTQSQNAVDAIEELFADPLDDRLSELVDWLVGNVLQRPRSHPLLQPIKARCKLRDVLNAALRRADPPLLRARVPAPQRRPEASVLVLPSSQPASRPSPATRPAPAPRSATVTTPLLTPRPSSSSSAAPPPSRVTPLVVPRPVVVSQPLVAPPSAPSAGRCLIIDCATSAAGEVVFRYDQSTVSSYIRGPAGEFFGFCNAATGRFLQDPNTIESYLKSTAGRAKLSTAQGAYESVGKADVFITNTFGLTHLGTSEAQALTPQNVLKCVDAARGTRMALYVLSRGGGGHAIGIMRSASSYLFLDVNEGMARLPSRDALWNFLFYYITNGAQGLDKEYPQFCMAYWA